MSNQPALQLLRRMANYHSDVTKAVIASVPSAAVAVNPVPVGFGSILATANHIAAVDELWLARITSGGTDRFDYLYNNTDLSKEDMMWFDLTKGDWETTRHWMLDNSQKVRRYTEGLIRDAQLQELCTYTTTNGALCTINRGDALLHLFNHATSHRGQIHSALSTLNIQGATDDMTAVLPKITHVAEMAS